jgi:hypothetical protein
LYFELVTKGFQLPWVLLLHKNLFFQRGSLCQVQLVLLLLRFTTRRVLLFIVLNSVTSTPQWIRQPEPLGADWRQQLQIFSYLFIFIYHHWVQDWRKQLQQIHAHGD